MMASAVVVGMWILMQKLILMVMMLLMLSVTIVRKQTTGNGADGIAMADDDGR